MAAAGVAAAAAGARGPGGPEEESVLWEGHRRPRDPGAPPRLREPRGEALGLEVGGLEATEGEWSQFWGF